MPILSFSTLMPRNDQGIFPSRYQLIPRVLIFIFNNCEVLLLHGKKDKPIWPGKYNGVGGHLEKGEDAITAARRELLEESGISCKDLTFCGNIFIDTGQNPGILLFVFKGHYQGEKLIRSEEGDLEWIDLDKLSDYPLVEDLFQLIPRVYNWKPGMRYINGRYYYNDDDLVTNFDE